MAKGKDYRGADAVHWSFGEFDELLHDEEARLTLSTARISNVKELPGGSGTRRELPAMKSSLIDRAA